MATPAKKTPTENTPGRPSPGARASPTPGASSRVNQSPTPATAASSNGLARTRSIRNGPNTPVSARAAAKRPGSISTPRSSGNVVAAADTDEDARAEAAALIDDLKAQLQRAELASDEYRKQLEMAQARLDDALLEQAKLEDRLYEGEERIEGLQNENKDLLRQKREIENIYETERAAMMQDKEHTNNHEEELQMTIQRLKETLAQKGMRANMDDESRQGRRSNNSSPNLDNGHFAPPAISRSNSSSNNSRLILQKDKLIESLRLELAEAQIKLIEMENMGGGRLQEVERMLLEARMANARLMEDNESYQLLLNEKTLNGDFARSDFMQPHHDTQLSSSRARTGLGSLADELESVAEGESENYRRLEAEAKSLRDQNKALTLYINNIIERLLQHKDFEAILDKTPDLMSGPKAPGNDHSSIDGQPPPPPPKDGAVEQPSLLQRAKSITGRGTTRPTKPSSIMPPPATTNISAPMKTAVPVPSANEDPEKAPAIPLTRSQSLRTGVHRRARSEWQPAAVVNQMYRGQPTAAAARGGGPLSPTASGQSFFGGRSVSGGQISTVAEKGDKENQRMNSSSNSVVSDLSGAADGETSATSTSSPPRVSTGTAGNVIAGRTVRPLRLVQENPEVEDGNIGGLKRSQSKRSSWMGWFNRGAAGEGPQQTTQSTPLQGPIVEG